MKKQIIFVCLLLHHMVGFVVGYEPTISPSFNCEDTLNFGNTTYYGFDLGPCYNFSFEYSNIILPTCGYNMTTNKPVSLRNKNQVSVTEFESGVGLQTGRQGTWEIGMDGFVQVNVSSIHTAINPQYMIGSTDGGTELGCIYGSNVKGERGDDLLVDALSFEGVYFDFPSSFTSYTFLSFTACPENAIVTADILISYFKINNGVSCTANPTEQPSFSPSYTPTASPSCIPTYVPSHLPSVSPSYVPSSVPSFIPSVRPTITPSVLPTSPSCSPTLIPTKQPTSTPSIIPSNSPSVMPSKTPTYVPSVKPTVNPSTNPSYLPTFIPSVTPSFPTVEPTLKPSVSPSDIPTFVPSNIPTITPSTPTGSPSFTPTVTPTGTPTITPSVPTATPTRSPTYDPTSMPSVSPTTVPMIQPSSPTLSPTTSPTFLPSISPSKMPSFSPTFVPSASPSVVPSYKPSLSPSFIPSVSPSCIPSSKPSITPSYIPSVSPSNVPTITPSFVPTVEPTFTPSRNPTITPTRSKRYKPTALPTPKPSAQPTYQPSSRPSTTPSYSPSSDPTYQPSAEPSINPTYLPSNEPSFTPSFRPSSEPSYSPTYDPSFNPSSTPSAQPSTVKPTADPSHSPSAVPTALPSYQPSTIPSSNPSSVPSVSPSSIPSDMPSVIPSSVASSIPSKQPLICPYTPEYIAAIAITTISPAYFLVNQNITVRLPLEFSSVLFLDVLECILLNSAYAVDVSIVINEVINLGVSAINADFSMMQIKYSVYFGYPTLLTEAATAKASLTKKTPTRHVAVIKDSVQIQESQQSQHLRRQIIKGQQQKESGVSSIHNKRSLVNVVSTASVDDDSLNVYFNELTTRLDDSILSGNFSSLLNYYSTSVSALSNLYPPYYITPQYFGPYKLSSPLPTTSPTLSPVIGGDENINNSNAKKKSSFPIVITVIGAVVGIFLLIFFCCMFFLGGYLLKKWRKRKEDSEKALNDWFDIADVGDITIYKKRRQFQAHHLQHNKQLQYLDSTTMNSRPSNFLDYDSPDYMYQASLDDLYGRPTTTPGAGGDGSYRPSIIPFALTDNPNFRHHDYKTRIMQSADKDTDVEGIDQHAAHSNTKSNDACHSDGSNTSVKILKPLEGLLTKMRNNFSSSSSSSSPNNSSTSANFSQRKTVNTMMMTPTTKGGAAGVVRKSPRYDSSNRQTESTQHDERYTEETMNSNTNAVNTGSNEDSFSMPSSVTMTADGKYVI